MRFVAILSFFAVFMLTCAPHAEARSKSWLRWVFTPPVPDFETTYLYDGKTPHAYTWADESWTPDDWTQARGSDKGVMDDLYAAGIITDQYEKGNMPVLEVGQSFMQLSNEDKHKVAAYVDDVLGITAAGTDGAFMLIRQGRNAPIGLYTKAGLQLQ